MAITMEEAAMKIVVALDSPSLAEAQPVIDRLSGRVGGFKVASTLCTAEGVPAVAKAVVGKAPISFLDLKFHDIPQQVRDAVAAATAHGFSMINVHASGGLEMMMAAQEGAAMASMLAGLECPTLIAVTVLTTLNFKDLVNLGVLKDFNIIDPDERKEYEDGELRRLVRKLALAAGDAGLDGVVASSQEVAVIKDYVGQNFRVVTPGIRLPGSDAHDQKRVGTPDFAISSGADYLVVGRDLTGPSDPEANLEEYCRRIAAVA